MKTITIPLSAVHADMTCRVCLGIVRQCMTVMECLHRFCAECIEKSLRYGKKECPACRVSCPSRRNLRRDKQWDELISKFYPNLDIAEAEQELVIKKVIQTHQTKELAQRMEEGVLKQRANAKIRPRPVLSSSSDEDEEREEEEEKEEFEELDMEDVEDDSGDIKMKVKKKRKKRKKKDKEEMDTEEENVLSLNIKKKKAEFKHIGEAEQTSPTLSVLIFNYLTLNRQVLQKIFLHTHRNLTILTLTKFLNTKFKVSSSVPRLGLYIRDTEYKILDTNLTLGNVEETLGGVNGLTLAYFTELEDITRFSKTYQNIRKSITRPSQPVVSSVWLD